MCVGVYVCVHVYACACVWVYMSVGVYCSSHSCVKNGFVLLSYCKHWSLLVGIFVASSGMSKTRGSRQFTLICHDTEINNLGGTPPSPISNSTSLLSCQPQGCRALNLPIHLDLKKLNRLDSQSVTSPCRVT